MGKKVSLKRGIAVIFGANILNLLFNLLTNFLLPKYLSVDCYAEIKTFQLYISYAGILHFGYEDGMYIKYGGCSLKDIESKGLKADLNTLVSFQLLLTFFLLTGSIAVGNVVWIACSLAIFPLNVACYYTLLFQASGEFEIYAKVSNVTTIITFTANMVLLFLGCFEGYQYFLSAYVIIDFVMMMVCSRWFKKHNRTQSPQKAPAFVKSIFRDNVKNGMFLMLGNFSSMILTGMDRWFIKALMDNTAFAMYSFAVSMEGLMNVAVSPISTTLYNYFCSHTDENELKSIKSKIVLFATLIVACVFPAKFVLEKFLLQYIDAESVLIYLFAAQIFYIIVKCFYVNLYKAQKKQKTYFVKLTLVIIGGFVLNAVCYALLHTKEAFAIGTLICGMLWLLISEIDFKQLKSSNGEMLYLVGAVIGYILIGTTFEAITGFFTYLVLVGGLGLIFMKKEVFACFQIAKELLNK